MDINMARKCKDTALCVVDALCADYGRRERLITSECKPCIRVEVELRYYNFKIIEAAEEIVGERYARTMIKEIGDATGYAHTALDYMSEATYKETKREVRENIAKRLHLTE